MQQLRDWFRYEPVLWVWVGVFGVLIAASLIAVVRRAVPHPILRRLWATAIVAAAIYAAIAPLIFEDAVLKERRRLVMAVAALGGGLELYAQDHDDRLPLAENWGDQTLPYVARSSAQPMRLFRCDDSEGYAFAYNASLSGQMRSELAGDPILLAGYCASTINDTISDVARIPENRHFGLTAIYRAQSKGQMAMVAEVRAEVSVVSDRRKESALGTPAFAWWHEELKCLERIHRGELC